MTLQSRIYLLFKKSPFLFIIGIVFLIVLPALAFLAAQNASVSTSTGIDFYGVKVNTLKLFGQKEYGETTRNLPTANGIYHGSGVIVDKSTSPNKVYVIDSGNNRILGFNGAGKCSQNQSISCTVNADCGQNNRCIVDGTKPADKVFGQPDFTHGSCNGDNNLGFKKRPTASTLCLTYFPYASNVAEQWMRLNPDVDSQGNLYMVDTYNNRVLKYNQPFSTDTSDGKGDTVADFVWGQDDFTSNFPNRNTGSYFAPGLPDDHSLWINHGVNPQDHVASRGVSVDINGNVWVADTYNNRILRFGPNSKNADLVLGQPNFTSRGCSSNGPLNKMCTPTNVKLHPTTGDLYVIDEFPSPFKARMLVYRQSFTNGMSAAKTIIPRQPAPFENWGGWDGHGNYVFQATGFAFNTYKQGEYAAGEIWINEHETDRTLLIDFDGNIIKVLNAKSVTQRGGDSQYNGCPTDIYTGNHIGWVGGAMGFDSENNIYLADEWFYTVYRYAIPYNLQPNGCLPDGNGVLFPKGPNKRVPERLGEALGVATANNQLFAFDESAEIKVWNNYMTKQDGAAPDYSLRGTLTRSALISSSVDDHNRLWLLGEHGELKVYQLPITSSTNQPLKDFIKLYWSDDQQEIPYQAYAGITFDKINKALYMVDDKNHRVFRIKNYDDFNNKLFVDMVIGQPNKTSVKCNFNQDPGWVAKGPPTASSLCAPYQIRFDKIGNLYVVENNFECHGNNRITVFLKEDLQNAQGLFPLIAAKRVFNKGSLTEQADFNKCIYTSTVTGRPVSPVMIAFDSNNHMVISNDGAYGDANLRETKQIWFYPDPTTSQLPAAAISLPLGVVAEMTFDDNDNLVVRDGTWPKVWIINPYEIDQNNPSKCAWLTEPLTNNKLSASNGVCTATQPVQNPNPTNSPTPTPTITPSPSIAYNPPPPANTPTPTRTPTPTQPVNTVDNTPPTVTITSPKNNAVIGKYTIAQLAATASDTSGIKLMTISVDGKPQPLKSCPNNPVNCIVYYGFTPGSHTVTFTATDYATPVANTTVKSVTITKSQ